MKRITVIIAVVAGVALLGFHEWRLSQKVASVTANRDSIAQEISALNEKLRGMPREIQEKLDRAENTLAVAEVRLNAMTAKAAALEQQLQALQAQAQAARSALPAGPRRWQPASEPQSPPPSEYAAVFPKRRHWGPEEVTGPPDTAEAGDIPTAWASQSPDGGPEWLKLDYDNPVEIAEVRVRETHNPGAITKVTAFTPNGDEVVLWEGTATPGPAPNDFVVPVAQRVNASRIKVYLDSQRVSGWNEIDAVELVGQDGSRQWARNATASTTFAESQSRLGSFRSTFEVLETTRER